MISGYYCFQTIQTFYFFPNELLSFIEINFNFHQVGRGSMQDYFRLQSKTQLPSSVDNFHQQLLHHDTSFIAFSMNELKKEAKT